MADPSVNLEEADRKGLGKLKVETGHWILLLYNNQEMK
jgi:hypothetical protein